MTVAALVFCSVLLLPLFQGFGAPAFREVLLADAFSATIPYLAMLLVARYALRRWLTAAVRIHRTHLAMQVGVATMSFGWWWVEPHMALLALSSGSLAAMGWQALAGVGLGLAFAWLAGRSSTPDAAREILPATWVGWMLAGGSVYRAHDHVEAGTRIAAAAGIAAAALALGFASFVLLRRRPRLAAGIPALAPALACAVMLAVSSRGGPAALSTKDSVLLVVVDTLRADIADGRFPADPDAMPELARIAAAGTRFTQAVSPAPWTLPATVSLLSGWNPHRHGFGASASEWEVSRGDPGALYLAPSLRDAGYLTAVFANNPWLRPWFGLDRGFYTARPYHGRAFDGVGLLLDWMQQHADSPSFAMLHLMDPHWPYDAPEGFGPPRQECNVCDYLFWSQFGPTTSDQREELRRRYAAEVRYTDAMLGRLYDALGATGTLDHTWLVVTSDHGEEFWEHGGFLHGHSLQDELLRVPLVVVPPRSAGDARRGQRVDAQVRLEDVAATILDVAGLDPAAARDGRTLRPLLEGQAEATPRTSVAGYVKSRDDLRVAVRRPPWKAIVSPTMAGNRLFDLASDPAEQQNMLFRSGLAPARSAQVQDAFLSLVTAPARLGLDVHREVATTSGMHADAETTRRLRSLGYAQ